MIHPPQLVVRNIVDQLPTANLQNLHTRALSEITMLVWHWDGGAPIQHGYDPLTYYKGEARYHINKDWGDGTFGHGLMYHGKLDRYGVFYWTRLLEHIVWAAFAANRLGVMICVDATHGQGLSAAQRLSMPRIEQEVFRAVGRVLPVTGHGLLTQYGNNTDCPGPEILEHIRRR